jgi:hypothetical protein
MVRKEYSKMKIDANILRKTASAIRDVRKENDELRAERDSLLKTAEAYELASKLLINGELDSDDFLEKVAEFSEGNLDVIKTAMTQFTSATSVDFGDVREEEKLASFDGAEDALTEYLMSLA